MAHANPEQPEQVIIKQRKNLRGADENFITGQHVSLPRLKEKMQQTIPHPHMMKYLKKTIPPYPTPVEFWVSDVTHVTKAERINMILDTERFEGEFSWWGLKMNKDEIKSAERRYMKKYFPNQSEELEEERRFLKKFTTSPPFQTEKSRYGNYRFTFPLTVLMQWYKQQICDREEPVLRVYETVAYKQEIMYTVLIHAPEENGQFEKYPLLQESEWVQYQDGKIIWKAQAICETHQYKFDSGEVQKLDARDHEFYVWDHVSLVFHLQDSAALTIPREQLIQALEACKIDEIDLLHPKKKEKCFNDAKEKEKCFNDAKKKVSELKRELEEEEKEEKEEEQEKKDEAKV